MRVIEVCHSVKDFETWKIGFDEHKPNREKYGLIDVELLTDPSDHNKVTVIFEETISGGFERFSEKENLEEVMRSYGVVGKPEFSFFIKETA